MTCNTKFGYDCGIMGETTKNGQTSFWCSLLVNWKHPKFDGDIILLYGYDSVPIKRRRVQFVQKCWKKKFACEVNDDLYC